MTATMQRMRPLTIEDQRLDPPVAFGTVVPSGYNEDGDLLNGAFIYNVTAADAGACRSGRGPE